MKTVQFGIKYWLSSCGVGLVVFLFISFLTGNSRLEPFADILLRPGAELATLTGFGSHDWQGFLLYILGNLAFYCALFLGVFRFLKVGAR